jgi:hypothetical protein
LAGPKVHEPHLRCVHQRYNFDIAVSNFHARSAQWMYRTWKYAGAITKGRRFVAVRQRKLLVHLTANRSFVLQSAERASTRSAFRSNWTPAWWIQSEAAMLPIPLTKVLRALTQALICQLLLVSCGGGVAVTPPASGAYEPSTGRLSSGNGCPTILVLSSGLTLTTPNVHLRLTDALLVRKPFIFHECKVVSETHPPATWHASGGNLHVANNGKAATFSSAKLGLYTISAAYKHYNATAAILVQLNNERVLSDIGGHPNGGLLLSGGVMYGVTYTGGGPPCYCGTVFKLVPGSPSATTIYTFQDNAYPYGTLVADGHGNLFGFANSSNQNGYVYELTASSSGYTKRIIHRFQDDASMTGLTAGDNGALFGTTLNGRIFKLTPSGSSYAYSLLYQFKPEYANGEGLSGIAISRTGKLYGTNSGAPGPHGSCVCGIVYELVPKGSSYKERTIYTFPSNASEPTGVVVAANGTLYGASVNSVYEFRPSGDGYAERIVYTFSGGAEGSGPGGVTLGADGALYGVTSTGGVAGVGTVFALTPNGTRYRKRTLHTFAGGPADGANPNSNVVVGASGEIDGTTEEGGTSQNDGTVFQVRP